jgi:hypothetical protein
LSLFYKYFWWRYDQITKNQQPVQNYTNYEDVDDEEEE